MPEYCGGLVLLSVYLTCISAVENKAKAVVFSYASASHPHVATLSHHYRPPPEPQQYVPDSDQRSRQYLPNSNQHPPQYLPNSGHNLQQYSPNPGQLPQQHVHPSSFQNLPPSPAHVPLQHPPSQPYQPGLPESYRQGDDRIHYDRTSNEYHPLNGSPTPFHDYTTITPQEYDSSTVYHNQPVENHYQPNSVNDLPDYDQRFDGRSTVPPDLGYSPTPIYYDDHPPDIHPPQGHDHPSSGITHSMEAHHGPSNPHLPQDLHNQHQSHHYTSPQPDYYNSDYRNNNNNIPMDYGTPQNIPIAQNPQFESNLTYPPPDPNRLPDLPENQNFPDYQPPDSPEYFDHSSLPPRGDKTFSPLPPSPTPVFYDDENDYISTTPIVEFESVKENLPPIKDYPPPNPGYLTKPLKIPRKKIEREQRTRRPSVHEKSADKVLQKPKYFAYSTDVLDDHNDGGGEIEQVGNHSVENEEDDHEQKKKDEKHAKGGGQEHHSAHKTAAGDKGNKGYKSGHKHEEGKKGHHEKEDHKGKYVDEKGKKGKKEEEAGHYGEHHKAHKGKKAAKYGESGEHKKGHSTKGEHNIHKMDEYMKKHEFYDEHHEGGDHEKFGGFMEAHAHKKGGKKKKGHHNGGHHHKHKGKKGHHEKGHKLGHHKSHKDAKGYDGHFSKHKKYGKKGGSKKGKKWGYSKGHPPK